MPFLLVFHEHKNNFEIMSRLWLLQNLTELQIEILWEIGTNMFINTQKMRVH